MKYCYHYVIIVMKMILIIILKNAGSTCVDCQLAQERNIFNLNHIVSQQKNVAVKKKTRSKTHNEIVDSIEKTRKHGTKKLNNNHKIIK